MARIAVDVCVTTFRRPKMLARLLESLNALRIEENIVQRIIVVDNDRDGSARSTVQAFAASCRWPIHYEIESQQNIALARNRCVELSQASYLAFIDDDEIATETWLQQLVDTLVRLDADGVFGPVVPLLPADSPEWIIRGRFFEWPRPLTGSEASEPATGNALISAEWMRRWPGPFDASFGLSGGEDTDLFWRFKQAGARLVWCNEAVAYEEVSADRVNARYLMRRSLCAGQNFARVSMRGRGPLACLVWLGYRLLLLGAAILATAVTWPFGRHVGFRALRKVCTNLGQLSILVGMKYEPYRRASET